MDKPLVSVVIVNWNHGHLLPPCLDALLAQEGPPFDITVVDNASVDGSPGWLPRLYPTVQLGSFSHNSGFSAALNWGIAHTTGDFLLSLNPDVIARPSFLAELVRVACADARIGTVAPKLLQADRPTHLDSTGLFIDRRRRPYDRGQGEADLGHYDSSVMTDAPLGSPGVASAMTGQDAFGACGAAALYRRTMLQDVAPDGEWLDEDFFAYYEDADLAWRAQSRGWRCAYAPYAVATHARGWGDTLRKQGRAAKRAAGPRLALRNRYLMVLKNDSLSGFLTDLPRILLAELPRLGYAAVTHPSILLGLIDLVRAAPSARLKRGQIRGRRTIEDAAIRRWFAARDNRSRLR